MGPTPGQATISLNTCLHPTVHRALATNKKERQGSRRCRHRRGPHMPQEVGFRTPFLQAQTEAW